MPEAPVGVLVRVAGSLHDTVEADELADGDSHGVLTMAQTGAHRGYEVCRDSTAPLCVLHRLALRGSCRAGLCSTTPERQILFERSGFEAIVGSVDEPAVEEWIRSHVVPTGRIETVHERPWSKVSRVPVADGVVWFKACATVQAFEPRLTARLSERWTEWVTEVLAHDEERAWLLTADAGQPLAVYGNPPERWLEILPSYAGLQRGEASYADDHLSHGVPDQRIATLAARFDDLLQRDLPLESGEIRRLRAFEPSLARLCEDLDARGVPETVQHDDLHMNNVYLGGDRLRVLDWGDASISHPFASLVVTFRFLEERNKLAVGDPWFRRLRDAYLEGWGPGLAGTFDLAFRVGSFAHATAWARQRDHLPADALGSFDTGFAIVLRRAIAQMPR